MTNNSITYNHYHNEHPESVLIQLKQWVSRRINSPSCAYFYVGQTSNPETRFASHQRRWAPGHEWNEMHVIYGHQCHKYVTDVENALIEHLRNSDKSEIGTINEKGPMNDGKQKFSVYLLQDSTPAGKKGKPETKPDKSSWTKGQSTRDLSADMRQEMIQKNFDRAIEAAGPKSALRALYVGYTNNADRRFYEHQNDSKWKYDSDHWDRMDVLYTTSSLNRAKVAESKLISHALEKYPAECQNGPATVLEDGRLPYAYVYYLEQKSKGA